MSDGSAIEWTDATWNPVTGCTKVSPGCKHCYAERFAERFRGVPGHPFEQGFDIRLWPERLEEPLHWRRPRRVFVNSMSDLFHPEIPEEFVDACFRIMNLASWHQFQVLTKRPERALALADRFEWTPNIWMGVSVESQLFTSRVAILKRIPGKVRFLSCEPLLGPLKLNLRGVHWVIVGGESGPGARPMRPEWVRGIRAQCRRAAVPFFFKQWGGVVKSRTGRLLDRRTYDEMPTIGEAQATSPPLVAFQPASGHPS